jgi:hypothetical protein
MQPYIEHRSADTRHRILMLLMTMLLGASMSVGIAWAAHLSCRSGVLFREWLRTTQATNVTQWPTGAPRHWPPAETLSTEIAPGVSRHRWIAGSGSESTYYYATSSYGWPQRCFSSIDTAEMFDGQLIEQVSNGVLHVPDRWDPIGGAGLPLHVRPAAFAANTVFWGLMFIGMAYGPRAMWRLLRKQRGVCQTCGYPRTGLCSEVPCPECGTNPV